MQPCHPSHSAQVRRNKFNGKQSVWVQNSNKPKYLENKTTHPPLQCWGFKEPHLYRDCPINENMTMTMNNIQEATIVNDMARCRHKINVSEENRRVDHQYSMVEIECTINHKPASILIDTGEIFSYISSIIVKYCKLDEIDQTEEILVNGVNYWNETKGCWVGKRMYINYGCNGD